MRNVELWVKGYIGYHLQQAITNQLKQRKLNQRCVSLTQVEVDKNDLAFKNPSKPIGNFYSKQQVDQLTKEKAWVLSKMPVEVIVVLSQATKPLRIVELDTIKKLIRTRYYCDYSWRRVFRFMKITLFIKE